MNKLLFLALIFVSFMSYDTVDARRRSNYMGAVQELDHLLLTANWDVNRPGKLPTTPRAIMESWCRPMLDKFARGMDIIDSLFEQNSALIIINRISAMTQIRLSIKLCKSPHIISKVAHYNKKFNRIIPRLMKWYKITLNTYLSVADPESEAGIGELGCLAEKSGLMLLAAIPPNLRKALINFLTMVYMKDVELIKGILTEMKIGDRVTDCQLEEEPAPNPHGIQSVEMAALFAWDKVLRDSDSGSGD